MSDPSHDRGARSSPRPWTPAARLCYIAGRMPRWKKSPPELVSAFDRLVPARGVERRSMFGYPAAFVGGNMFAGLHEDRVVLRLDEEGAAEAKEQGAADFEPMPGRRMAGWVAVAGKSLADEVRMRQWIARALAHVSTMPAKPHKPAARKR